MKDNNRPLIIIAMLAAILAAVWSGCAMKAATDIAYQRTVVRCQP